MSINCSLTGTFTSNFYKRLTNLLNLLEYKRSLCYNISPYFFLIFSFHIRTHHSNSSINHKYLLLCKYYFVPVSPLLLTSYLFAFSLDQRDHQDSQEQEYVDDVFQTKFRQRFRTCQFYLFFYCTKSSLLTRCLARMLRITVTFTTLTLLSHK